MGASSLLYPLSHGADSLSAVTQMFLICKDLGDSPQECKDGNAVRVKKMTDPDRKMTVDS